MVDVDRVVLEDDVFDDEQPRVLKETIPALENGWGSYGRYQLVGNGEVTNGFCGTFLSLKGCLRVDLHKLITLDGNNFKGKVFVRRVHHWCNKPSCPICFKSGWAVREAGNIEARLVEASKHFGLIEHIVASIPLKDYGLSFEDLRVKAKKALKVRGVIGGCMIFHGFRYHRFQHFWYFSPHFHILGFILDGYGKCRGCKKICSAHVCNCFEARTRKEFEKDGFIVKVLDKRKTVFGSAWYQLNHASLKVNSVRFHVASWFGVCSYRKLKVTVELRKSVCPICQHDLERIRYFGVKRLVFDGCNYVRDSFEDYEEDGRVVWVESVKCGSGNYEE